MLEPQRLCVVDNTVFIDFHAGKLLPELFCLPIKFISPNVIVEEVDKPDGDKLIEYGLEKKILSGNQVEEVDYFHSRYKEPSANDIAALILARDLQATLLTGDRGLREAAETEGVSVHGTLWILDQLLESNLITHSKAREALKKMMAKNRWLPKAECTKRLKKWKAMNNNFG